MPLNLERLLQLIFGNLSVMQEDLAEKFFWIIRAGTDNYSVLQKDLLNDTGASDFERACLSAHRQKLEQVRDTHCFQSSVDTHRVLRRQLDLVSDTECGTRAAKTETI